MKKMFALYVSAIGLTIVSIFAKSIIDRGSTEQQRSNEHRIIKEIIDYGQNNGCLNDAVNRFMKYSDDLELWDLLSDEEKRDIFKTQNT